MADGTAKRIPFSPGDRVMHPAHGVGTVGGVEAFEASGLAMEVLRVAFDDSRMELRIPLPRLAASGLRPLSTPAALEEALAVLAGRAKSGRGMWAKRATDYQTKIKSGDPRVVAEVIRDAGRNRDGDQSFSERQILETALDRLACEMAAVEGIPRPEAVERILARLPKAAPAGKGAPAPEDMADAA